MFRLSDAHNTYNPCLLVIRSKGYGIEHLDDKFEGSDCYYWKANKGNKNYYSNNPISLLGLISVFEEFGENEIINNENPIEMCPEEKGTSTEEK